MWGGEGRGSAKGVKGAGCQGVGSTKVGAVQHTLDTMPVDSTEQLPGKSHCAQHTALLLLLLLRCFMQVTARQADTLTPCCCLPAPAPAAAAGAACCCCGLALRSAAARACAATAAALFASDRNCWISGVDLRVSV